MFIHKKERINRDITLDLQSYFIFNNYIGNIPVYDEDF